MLRPKSNYVSIVHIPSSLSRQPPSSASQLPHFCARLSLRPVILVFSRFAVLPLPWLALLSAGISVICHSAASVRVNRATCDYGLCNPLSTCGFVLGSSRSRGAARAYYAAASGTYFGGGSFGNDCLEAYFRCRLCSKTFSEDEVIAIS